MWPGAKLKNLLLVGPQIDYDQISVAIFILHRPQLIGPWIVPQSVVVTDDRKGTYGISPEIILDDITLCPARAVRRTSVPVPDEHVGGAKGYRVRSAQTARRGRKGRNRVGRRCYDLGQTAGRYKGRNDAQQDAGVKCSEMVPEPTRE